MATAALRSRLPALGRRAIFAAVAIVACAEFVAGPESSDREVRAIRLDAPALTVDDGQTLQIVATVLDQTGTAFAQIPAGLQVQWNSSDPNVATVDNDGLLTAVHPGAAQVSASVSGNFGTVSVSSDLTVRPVPTDMSLVAGDAQQGLVAEALLDNPRIKVVDRHGDGVPNIPMVFAITAGGGTIETAAVTTDATGVAQATWTLGTVAGQNALEVRFAPPRLPNRAITFNAQARPGAIASLLKVSGDNQTAVTRFVLPAAFVARVTDRFGNAIPDVTVDWSVTGGGGSLSVASSTSDGNGMVSTRLTLGASGPQTVMASVAGVLTLTYSATAVVPVATLDVTPTSANVASGTTQQLTATARDAGGNVLTGRAVAWSSNATTVASVDANGLVTGAHVGGATITATVDGVSGTASVTVQPGAVSFAQSSLTVAANTVASGATTTATFVARDAASNMIPGLDVAFSVRVGPPGTSTGTLSPTTDHGDGTYSAVFTGVLAGGPASIDVAASGQGAPTAPQVSVTPGAAATATSTVTVSQPVVAVGATATLRLQARDAAGNALTSGGLTVLFGASGGSSVGAIGPTIDNGDGTYRAEFSAQSEGTPLSITATISGSPVTTASPTLQVVPASTGVAIHWILQTGLWSNASGWNPARLPEVSDTAYVETAGAFTLTVDQNVALAKLVVGSIGGGTTVDASGRALGVIDSVVVRTGSTLQLGSASSLTVPALRNNGTTRLSGTEVFATLRNDGDLLVQSSGGATSALNGSLDNRGRVVVDPGVVFTVSGPTFSVATTGTLAGAGTVDVANVAGDLQLAGTVSPGVVTNSTASLAINGDLVVAGSGARTFEIDLGGTTAGSQYDQLLVSGQATLTGATLNVHLVAGFVPAPGQSFIILTHVSRIGTFAAVNLPALPLGQWQVTHGSTELVLAVVIPTPTQLAFTQQPTDATAGTLLSPAPQVEIREASGALVSAAVDSVTVAVVDAGGIPTGQSYTVAAVGGVATFSNVALTTAAGHRLVASSGALTGATSALFTILPSSPSTLSLLDGDGQTGAAGQQLAQPLRVRVFDAFGNGVPGVSVAFAVTAGTGILGTPAAVTSNSAPVGVATTTWTLGGMLGSQGVQATISQTTPVAFDATSTAGPAAQLAFVVQPSGQIVNTAIAPAIQVQLQDALGNPVSGTNGITLAIANNPGSATLTGTVTQAAVNGVATFSNIALTQAGAGYTLSATAGGLSSSTSAAFNIAAAPAIQLSMGGNNVVGVLGQETVSVLLNAPAPGGGVTITVTSDAPGTVSLQPPGTTFIAAGEISGAVTINGVAIGSTLLHANSAGYQQGTLSVAATNQIISLPTTLNVAYGQQASIPVTLAVPAPGGGLTVTLTTTDATRVGVVTSTVNFAAGSQLQNGTVSGVFPGTATIRATAAGWAPDVSSAATTASLNIVESSSSLNPVFPSNVTVEFRSGGIALAAPSPGIAVTMTPTNPACAVATSPVTIPAGQVNVVATITYGGSAPLPCSTTLTASAPNLTSDNIPVTVNPPPNINLSGISQVGSGLQVGASGSLGAAPPGGTVVHLTSADPSLFRLSGSSTVAGNSGGTLDITLNPGTTSFAYYVQAMEGVTGSANVTASVPNFNNSSQAVTVVTPVYQLNGLSSTYTTLSPAAPIYAIVGIGSGTAVTNSEAVRAGGVPLTVQLESTSPGVAQLQTLSGTAATATVTIAPTQSNSPTNVAGGGAAVTFVGSGGATITSSITGLNATTGATRSTTVTAPIITLNGTNTLGSGLQQAASGSISSQAPAGGVTIHLASGDATKLRLSPNATTPGVATIDINLAQNTQSFTYYVQAIAGTTGTVNVAASATGFTGDDVNVVIQTPVFQLGGLGTSYNNLAPVVPFYVLIGIGSAGGISSSQAVRAGGDSIFATVTNSNATAARIDSGAVNGQSFLVAIAPGQSNSPTNLASGGIGFHPLAAGTTTVAATLPGFTPTTLATRSITVTSTAINLGGLQSIGSGLQVAASGSLSSPAPTGGVTVHLASADPARLLLAPNASSAGAATLNINVAQGQTGFNYTAQAIEGMTGTVSITATATGYSDGQVTATLVTPLIQVNGLAASYNTLAPNAPFTVIIGVGTTSIANSQVIRIGGSAVTATIVSSAPTVAQLVKTSTSGSSVTVTINPGQSQSPTTVAAGGVALDPLSTGSTDVSVSTPGFTPAPTGGTRTVTITTPVITLSGTVSLGSGLQFSTSGSLSQAAPAGGITVHLVSSDATRLLLAPNATTAGSGTLDIVVPQNNTSFSYVVQAIENQTATVSVGASASGYVDGSTNVSIVTPVFQINSLSNSYNASAANAPFTILIGVGNFNGVTSTEAVRFGGAALTATITNSQSGVAQLVTTGSTGQSVTVMIAAGQIQSPTTVAAGGVAFDPLAAGPTTVAATITGFTATLAATRSITVNP